jgi:hypothetical protein
MTPPEPLEDRLRRVLEQHAGQLQAVAPPFEPRSTRRAALPRRRLERSQFGLGGIAAMLATVSAAVIAVVALALVHHRTAVSHPGTKGPKATATTATGRTCSGPLTVAQLEKDFAVLARPQSAADRSWQQPVIPSAFPYEKLLGGVPGSTRLATTLTDGSEVFLTIERFVWTDQGNIRHPHDCYGHDLLVSLVAGGRAVGHFEWGSVASPGGTDANMPLDSSVSAATWVTLVSNQVRSVRWVFPRQNQNRTHLFPRALTVTVPVSGNVAAARVPRNQGFYPYSVAWLGAQGQVVVSKVYGSELGVSQPTQVLPKQAKITSGPVRDLLGANGIADVSFGASQASIEARLEQLYGRPDGPARALRHFCGADHVIEWGALGVLFDHSQFVGYAYPSSVYFSPQIEYADIPILATTGAVRVGEPVADVEQAYGSKFHSTTSREGYATWSLSASGGQLKGVTQRIRTSSGARVVVIGSIDAGLPGCPLLTFQDL